MTPPTPLPEPLPVTVTVAYASPPDLLRTRQLSINPDTGIMNPFAFVHAADSPNQGHLIAYGHPGTNLDEELREAVKKHDADFIVLCMETVIRRKDPETEPSIQHAIKSGTITESTPLPDDRHALVLLEFTPAYTRLQAFGINNDGTVNLEDIVIRDGATRDITRRPAGGVMNPFAGASEQ